MYATIRALALLGLGRYDAAWESLQEEIADQEHLLGRALKHFGMGMYYLELLAFEQATEVFEHTVEQAKRLGRSWLTPWAQVELSRSLLRRRRLDEVNLDWSARGLESTGTTLPADVPNLLGEIALFKGELDAALRQAEKACTEAEKQGWRPAHVSALELRLRVLLQLGRASEVIPLAEKGIRMAEAMAYRPLAWRVRAAKAQALVMLGDAETAANEYTAAAEVIRDLADSIGHAQLRDAFMSDTAVSSVLEHGNLTMPHLEPGE
jgi:tetratricopeptide (TPR) repeat protein